MRRKLTISPGLPSLSATRRGICASMPAGSAATGVAFGAGEEVEAEPLGEVEEILEVVPAGESARVLPLAEAPAGAGGFELGVVAGEETEALLEISILTWKLPLAESPDGPLIPRNNRPVTRTGNWMLAPIRNGWPASSEPKRPINAPRPAVFTGIARTRSFQLRAVPCGPGVLPSMYWRFPVAVIVTVWPGCRSTPVSVQG